MTHLDSLIGESGHVYRDQQTIADAYAYAMALWSQNTKILRELSASGSFYGKMVEDSAVQQVLNAAH